MNPPGEVAVETRRVPLAESGGRHLAARVYLRPEGGPIAPSPVLRIQDFLSARARRRDLPVLRELLDLHPSVALIDIGGGTGGLADSLATDCRELVVLEPEASRVEYGRVRHPHLRFVEGRAETIPFPAESFDRAMAIVSFHHVTDQRRALEEIHRVLKPSGRLVVQELDPTRGRGKLACFMENTLRHYDLAFLEPAALQRELEAASFRNVFVQSAGQGYFAAADK